MTVDGSPEQKSSEIRDTEIEENSRSENSNYSSDLDEAGIEFGNAIEFLPRVFVSSIPTTP